MTSVFAVIKTYSDKKFEILSVEKNYKTIVDSFRNYEYDYRKEHPENIIGCDFSVGKLATTDFDMCIVGLADDFKYAHQRSGHYNFYIEDLRLDAIVYLVNTNEKRFNETYRITGINMFEKENLGPFKKYDKNAEETELIEFDNSLRLFKDNHVYDIYLRFVNNIGISSLNNKTPIWC